MFEQNIKFHFDNILKWQQLQEHLKSEEVKKQLEEKQWDFTQKITEIKTNLNEGKKEQEKLNFEVNEILNLKIFLNGFLKVELITIT